MAHYTGFLDFFANKISNIHLQLDYSGLVQDYPLLGEFLKYSKLFSFQQPSVENFSKPIVTFKTSLAKEPLVKDCFPVLSSIMTSAINCCNSCIPKKEPLSPILLKNLDSNNFNNDRSNSNLLFISKTLEQLQAR